MTGRFLIALLAIMGVGGGAVYLAITQPGPWSAALATLAAVGAVVLLASAAFYLLWRPMLADFPDREPAPDAVRRRFQTLSIGIVNMGFSIHVAVDEQYLHLSPLPIWQRLGARPASIPWSAMEAVGTSGRVVRLAGRHRMDGPEWCLKLASPATP